ncbi:cilia- and flagella-associated protein 95 isoform X1 [Pelobates fuscus]|uniref:cilia- and flagella-associated protein 95 isoform X1 n=1 Tax=Pelobates fuscus TaxID=191477 RepID=UPI002FE4AAF2
MMYLMDEAANNELLETKGSLYLRSNHMHYGRPTYVTGWHQSREAEPKDYDLDAIPVGKKILSHSTYRRLGDMENGDWRTTSAEHLSQIHLKKDYEVKDVSKLINEDNIDTLNIERHTGHPEHGFGAVLPHHTKEHGKMNLETTYCTDYTAPYHYSPPNCPDTPDYSAAYKKCHSQFTDTADYRRFGRNTWQDESGIYANNPMKQIVFKPSCPITPHL